jgi:hypothetical protein
MRTYWVYILASKPRGTLYTGVTNADLYPSLPCVRPPSIRGVRRSVGPGDKPRDDS